MATGIGTIMKYDDSRGFGFLRQDGASADLFFHVREVDACLAEEALVAGTRVAFDLGTDRTGRPVATNIRRAQARAA